MFRTLYRCPRTIARHENGPLYESRRAYLDHLAAQGSSLKTVRVAAEVIYRAVIQMRLDSSSPIERTDGEKAAKDWANRPFGNENLVAPDHTIKEFRLVTCGWLRFAGRLRKPGRVPGPRQREIYTYCRYMEEERGLSPATIAPARQHLTKFFERVVKSQLIEFTIADVEHFLATLGQQGWTRNGIRSFAYRLRGFFKYGESQGWTKRGLSAIIRGPRRTRARGDSGQRMGRRNRPRIQRRQGICSGRSRRT
jgi:integrase/recombinase XerD